MKGAQRAQSPFFEGRFRPTPGLSLTRLSITRLRNFLQVSKKLDVNLSFIQEESFLKLCAVDKANGGWSIVLKGRFGQGAFESVSTHIQYNGNARTQWVPVWTEHESYLEAVLSWTRGFLSCDLHPAQYISIRMFCGTTRYPILQYRSWTQHMMVYIWRGNGRPIYRTNSPDVQLSGILFTNSTGTRANGEPWSTGGRPPKAAKAFRGTCQGKTEIKIDQTFLARML